MAASKSDVEHARALPRVRERVARLGFGAAAVDDLLAYIEGTAPILIHFKPQKLAHLFAADTHYRNQSALRFGPPLLSIAEWLSTKDTYISGKHSFYIRENICSSIAGRKSRETEV